MCGFYQGLGDFGVDTGDVDVQAGLEEIAFADGGEVYFGVDGSVGREAEFLLGCREAEGADEAG